VSFLVCFDEKRKHRISEKMNPNLYGWKLDTQSEKGGFPNLFGWKWSMSEFQEKVNFHVCFDGNGGFQKR